MKTRMTYALALCYLCATLALAQAAAGLEGTWVTDGVPAVEAAKKAKREAARVAKMEASAQAKREAAEKVEAERDAAERAEREAAEQ